MYKPVEFPAHLTEPLLEGNESNGVRDQSEEKESEGPRRSSRTAKRKLEQVQDAELEETPEKKRRKVKK